MALIPPVYPTPPTMKSPWKYPLHSPKFRRFSPTPSRPLLRLFSSSSDMRFNRQLLAHFLYMSRTAFDPPTASTSIRRYFWLHCETYGIFWETEGIKICMTNEVIMWLKEQIRSPPSTGPTCPSQQLLSLLKYSILSSVNIGHHRYPWMNVFISWRPPSSYPKSGGIYFSKYLTWMFIFHPLPIFATTSTPFT